MQKWSKLIYNCICQSVLDNLKLFHYASLNPRRSCTSRIRVRKILPSDVPIVVKIVRDNFSKCEPLIKGLQFPENQYSPALVEFWRNSIDQGMSYVAVPNRLTKIENSLGIIINKKILPWEPIQLRKFATCIKCPKTRDLIGLYNFIIKDSDIHNRFNVNKIFNITHIIYNEERSKNYNSKFDFINLSTILVDKALKIAQFQGYKLASLICTGKSLCQVAENLNMDKIYEFPYGKLFNDKLEPLVKPIEPNINVRIYIRKVGPFL